MSEEQYSWTPITVDEVVEGETYLRATHRADRRQVSEGLVVERDNEYLELATASGRRTIDTEYRDLERRELRPSTGAWVQATPENVRVGSKIKGAPYGIGGTLEAEVSDLLDNDPTRFRAKTLTIIDPTRNGRSTDLVDGPLGNGYYYHYADVQVWQESASVTVSPFEATWHPVDFAQLRNGDRIRVTFTNARGQTSSKEGTITAIQGARVTFQDQGGVAHAASSLRTYEISNRVPEPVPVLSERYPTIHHLKAAIFDVAAPNYKNGTWCSDTHDFLQELEIVDNLYPAEGLKTQADQVQSLIAKLQSESSSSRGISTASMEKAFEALGIPRNAAPRQKMMTLTIAVPLDYDTETVSNYVNNRNSNIVVEHVEES